jgi:hypothetical protein
MSNYHSILLKKSAVLRGTKFFDLYFSDRILMQTARGRGFVPIMAMQQNLAQGLFQQNPLQVRRNGSIAIKPKADGQESAAYGSTSVACSPSAADIAHPHSPANSTTTTSPTTKVRLLNATSLQDFLGPGGRCPDTDRSRRWSCHQYVRRMGRASSSTGRYDGADPVTRQYALADDPSLSQDLGRHGPPAARW